MTGREMLNAWRFRYAYEDEERREEGWKALAAQIDAAIAQAVAQEREACALLCEETKDCENDTDYYHTSEGHVRLADAIRGRTP